MFKVNKYKFGENKHKLISVAILIILSRAIYPEGRDRKYENLDTPNFLDHIFTTLFVFIQDYNSINIDLKKIIIKKSINVIILHKRPRPVTQVHGFWLNCVVKKLRFH